MRGNAQRAPLELTLNRFAEQKITDGVQVLGKRLPCHVVKITGQIVEVAFDLNSQFKIPNVSMPISTNQQDWLPIKVGTKGFADTGDYYVGGVSGQGGGTADLTQRANLSNSWFTPLTNKAWSPPGGGDQNDRIVGNGDNKGVLLVSKAGESKTVYLDENGNLIVKGNIHCMGEVIRGFGTGDSVTLGQHHHPQGNDSDGDTEQDTGAPIAGT